MKNRLDSSTEPEAAEPEAAEPEAAEPEAGEPGLSRFSVSLPTQLLHDLDAMMREKGTLNRSLAVSDMIREALVEHRQKDDEQEIAGTITLVYDHHKRNLPAALIDLQHDNTEVIISTLHVHLDHDNCLEVLVVRGQARAIRKMADALLAAKGVKHGRFSITSIGRDLSA